MKNRSIHTILFCAGLSVASFAQEAERFLAVRMVVEAEGERSSGFIVTVYNGNEEVMQLPPSPHDGCELILDINAFHTVRVSKPGLRDKLLSIDTHLPEGVERYKAYPCVVVMEKAGTGNHEDFFADFPNAVVRWNPEVGRFDHSDRYHDARQARDERTARN